MTSAQKRAKSVELLHGHLGKVIITKAELKSALVELKDELPLKSFRWLEDGYRIKRGQFRLPIDNDGSLTQQNTETTEISQNAVKGTPTVSSEISAESIVAKEISFIPDVEKSYVPWGHHKDLASIIRSKVFYPIFITGLSGNGKTYMVEQVCAQLKRECVRVNITVETDEDDLLGGFRLVNGETVFHKGPVVDAMERGAVLLLDEVDLASNKILCLQPVLEGKGVYLKKINQWVKPAEGFSVIATANTKGKGSDSGAFIGTNILNEAFLERFAITLEQEYPKNSVELKIVKGVFSDSEVDENESQEFGDKLVRWADIIRKTYFDGGVDEIISTRRLVHIAKAFAIFEDRIKSINLCIARFDEETKISFKELYEKIDGDLVEDISHLTEEQPF